MTPTHTFESRMREKAEKMSERHPSTIGYGPLTQRESDFLAGAQAARKDLLEYLTIQWSNKVPFGSNDNHLKAAAITNSVAEWLEGLGEL